MRKKLVAIFTVVLAKYMVRSITKEHPHAFESDAWMLELQHYIRLGDRTYTLADLETWIFPLFRFLTGNGIDKMPSTLSAARYYEEYAL